MLNEEGVTYGVISGSVDNEDRGQIAQDFQNGLFQVLVVTQAAKEGLTLTRANRAYFVERYWTPADEAQAEARIWRIGQTRPTTNYYLLVPGTVDQKMADIIDRKRETIDDVLGDEDIEKVYNTSAQQELLDDLAEQEGMLEGILPAGALHPPEAVKNPRQRSLFARRNPSYRKPTLPKYMTGFRATNAGRGVMTDAVKGGIYFFPKRETAELWAGRHGTVTSATIRLDTAKVMEVPEGEISYFAGDDQDVIVRADPGGTGKILEIIVFDDRFIVNPKGWV
jgi:hypothetical protein